MENRKELEIRNLTPEQLYALELAARRLRSEEMGRLIKAAAVAVRNFFAQDRRSGEVRHA
ncbi:MAG: hypothetical protein ACT4P4_16815 [Betaproteobacteria bacterium]